MSITPSRLAQLLAIAKANSANKPLPPTIIESVIEENLSDSTSPLHDTPTLPDSNSGIGRDGSIISYNSEQQEFISVATTRKSCILIGAAGTGKTTCMRGVINALKETTPNFLGVVHKYLPASNVPGIVAISFTRRAVANLRRAMPEGMEKNCITIHKLLEYEPQYFEVFDSVKGEMKKTMQFLPARNKFNPLPEDIHTIIIDESSMVSVELFKEILDACPHNVQFIFLGDIQQLPPVFGAAILGYKMLELPTIELVQVYRQALESPIIRLAHRILSGNPIPESEFPQWKYEGQLTLHPWKKKLHKDHTMPILAKFFVAALDSGNYDPEQDMILIPFNVGVGSIDLNKHIAQHLAKKRNAIVYEIQGGIQKLYISVGDKILYDREDAIVTDIKPNPLYLGTPPQPASTTLDYWGHELGHRNRVAGEEFSDDDMDIFLNSITGDDEDTVKKSSHIITIRMLDTDREIKLDKAGDVNSLLLSYVLTIHKSQGSEWRRVFFIVHNSHATMIQRELLYTAVTRAREELYVICEPETFVKGITSQKIKGNSLAEKAEFFKGKLETNGGY